MKSFVNLESSYQYAHLFTVQNKERKKKGVVLRKR